MEIFQATILGIVQGLTEFLPISSSGHLVLTPYFFGWEDPGLAFDVALHFGTLIAVLAYFWKDIIAILKINLLRQGFEGQVEGQENQKSIPSTRDKNQNEKNPKRYPDNMLNLLIVATIPGALAGYYFNDYAETIFRHPLLIAGALLLFGFLLFLADKKSKKCRSSSEINRIDAMIIGLVQAIAILPGVSRSGVTITAGLFQGLDRKSAARFSFLLSVPIIFGATLFSAKDFFGMNVGVAEIAGIIAAAVSGYLAIAGLIKFIEKTSYKIFFWYRLALALLIVGAWFWT